MSDFDPVSSYSSGFVGCRKDPRADEVFADYVLRYGGDPNGANVAYDWGLEQAGAGMIVLEAIPAALASQVTAAAKVPTIGIGAGVDCHGQVLVLHDMLDVYPGKKAKFVKNYMKAAAGSIQDAVALYVAEVRSGKFPGREHSF